jgi:hypothetical protein
MIAPPPGPRLTISIDTEPGERVDILAARLLVDLTQAIHAEGICATHITVEIDSNTSAR